MSAPLQQVSWLRVGDPFGPGNSRLREDDADPSGAQGIRFACPCGSGHLLVIWFSNPIGGGPAFDSRGWERTGETLETLTLAPSIHVNPGPRSCWHGYVRDGRAETA